VLFRWHKAAGRMLCQPVFITKPDCRIGPKKISDQLQHFGKRFTEITAGGKGTRQTIQSRGTFFTAALGLFALVQLRRQMSDDNSDNKIRTEHHEVFELTDVKSEAWRNEQEVPEQRAERGQKKCRPSPQTHSDDHDRKQIEERNRPVTDVVEH